MPGIRLVIENTSLDLDKWESVCNDLFEFIVDITPEDTGYCKDQWDMNLEDTSCEFVNDCEYASYLDEGWSKQAPNGMIGPALQMLPKLVQGYA